MVNDPLISLLPWMAVLAPFAGLALVYLILPRVAEWITRPSTGFLILAIALIVFLMEVRP